MILVGGGAKKNNNKLDNLNDKESDESYTNETVTYSNSDNEDTINENNQPQENNKISCIDQEFIESYDWNNNNINHQDDIDFPCSVEFLDTNSSRVICESHLYLLLC